MANRSAGAWRVACVEVLTCQSRVRRSRAGKGRKSPTSVQLAAVFSGARADGEQRGSSKHPISRPDLHADNKE